MIEIIGKVDAPDIEDDGMAAIACIEIEEETGTGGCFFVQLRSWNETPNDDDDIEHTTLDSLVGKRVRVRIEVLDSE